MDITRMPDPCPAHKHATAEKREVAQQGLILLAEVGSGVHGLGLASVGDDVDLMGITVEPPSYVLGLDTFEQFERHTAWDRSEGVRERSGRGDYDYLVYGARKFCQLALAGNPSILNLLFVPDGAVHVDSQAALELRESAEWFVSKRAAGKYLGYLHRQRLGMTGEQGAKVKRPELVAAHGYDTKYASHALRLGVQGIELMRHGHINLPMREPWRSSILSVKRGEQLLADVLDSIDHLETQLRDAVADSDMPEHPDKESVNDWLRRTYLAAWS